MAYHVTPARNVARILREGLVPRIGPRSRRLGEPVACVYVFPTAEDLSCALDNWLLDEFGEDAILALLEVDVPEDVRRADGAGYEGALLDPVPPVALRVLHRDLGDVADLDAVLGTGAAAPGR